MTEDNHLFRFMYKLNPWAQCELQRAKVKDLNTATVVAEGLTEWSARGTNSSVKSEVL